MKKAEPAQFMLAACLAIGALCVGAAASSVLAPTAEKRVETADVAPVVNRAAGSVKDGAASKPESWTGTPLNRAAPGARAATPTRDEANDQK